ncbi:MAG TPA: cupin domain-containing protein [Aquihabitans sp.]|nr:cupin domain-containing protein [Aquihabitans sp.]
MCDIAARTVSRHYEAGRWVMRVLRASIGPQDRPSPVVVHESERPAERDDRMSGVTWRTLVSGDRVPTSQLTVGVAELDPHGCTPRPHRHAIAETYYVLSGTGVLTIDGTTSPARPGTAAFIPPGAWHVLTNQGSRTLRVLYVLAADAFEDVVYEFPDA